MLFIGVALFHVSLDVARARPTFTTAVRDGGSPVAVGVRLDKVGSAARLTFDLSRSTAFTTHTLENPDRIVIESPAIDFQISADATRVKGDGAGIVKAFRFGQFVSGKSRIIIDLAAPARVESLDVSSIAGGDPSRLAIQLARCDRAAFHETAKTAAASEPTILPIDSLRPDFGTGSKPVVILDPGHGGIDPGAKGIGGVLEKQLVYEFAQTLAEKLNATGQVKVVLTRTGDAFVSLADRVRIARENKASLLVSLHADTVRAGPEVTGATVYTVSDTASDAEAGRVAEVENKADEQAGVEAAPEMSGVSDILFDLTRRETRTFSHAYQRTLTGYWRKIARLNKNPERSAGFMVLKAPDVPSVLLELGYLSSEKDVAALTSAEWRDKAASSVAMSISAFFANRIAGQQTVAGQLDTRAAAAEPPAVVVLQPHL